jgi:molybdopterin molybdotransferase
VEHENGEFVVRSAGKQDTGYLKTLLLADGIAIIPADQDGLKAGDRVDVHLLDGDGGLVEA